MEYAADKTLWGLILLLAVAVAMFAFGWWGRRSWRTLLSSAPRNRQRARREGQLRRGAVVWQVVGVLFAVLAIAGIVERLGT